MGAQVSLLDAVESGKVDIVKTLVKYGAAGNDDLPAELQDGRLRRYLRDRAGGIDVLAAAAQHGHLEIVKILLGSRDHSNQEIEKALRSAGGHTEIVLILREILKNIKRHDGSPKNNAGIFAERRRRATEIARQKMKETEDRRRRDIIGETAEKGGSQAVAKVDNPGYRMKEKPDAFALVVGVEKYIGLPPADFAERDAVAVKNHLIALGYPERNVIVLSGEAATRSGLQKYLEEWLPRNVRPSSALFFYFSGHGAPDVKTGQTYLVPTDGDVKFLQSTAYPLKQVYSMLASLKAKEIIVVLDSCFSGAGGRSVLPGGARPLVTSAVAETLPGGNITLFAATAADEITTTIEDQGHGNFTYFFLRGLSGEAKDDKGVVTAAGLYEYLKPKVLDMARRQNREQTPQYSSTAHQSPILARF